MESSIYSKSNHENVTMKMLLLLQGLINRQILLGMMKFICWTFLTLLYICPNSLALNRKLPFWKDSSSHPPKVVFPEIFHSEIILTWMSDIYEYLKSVTLFTNSLWKSWLLITKLGVWVALIFFISFRFVSAKYVIVLAVAKQVSATNLKINWISNFYAVKSAVELNRLSPQILAFFATANKMPR